MTPTLIHQLQSTDGTVKAWGHTSFGGSGVPASTLPAVSVAAGTNTFTMILRDGSIKAWPSFNAAAAGVRI